jgi:hypothetical protein
MSHKKKDFTTWLLVGAGAVAVYYAMKSAGIAPAITTPTPYSIYPEFAYTATTSMAASPVQKAPAAVIRPTPLFQAVQSQEQGAVLGQCVGSYPGCTIVMSDTQLGL